MDLIKIMTDNTDKSIYLTQQWLAEIQLLRQQLVELQHQRDQAWESSQKWCQLYNTEAEQRRLDSKNSKQAIALVKVELEKLRGMDIEIDVDPVATTSSLTAEISQLTTQEELHAKLIALAQERDRLLQALKIEKANHLQTRKSLTAALGDAIDSLAKARSSQERNTEEGEQGSRGAGEED